MMMRWMFAVVSVLCLASLSVFAAPGDVAPDNAHAGQPGFEPQVSQRPVEEVRQTIPQDKIAKFEEYLNACSVVRQSPKPEAFLRSGR